MTKARTKFFSMIGLALVAVLAFSLTFAFVGHIGVAEARESYYATEGDDWESGTFTELNYGLYWYTSDSAIPKKSNPVDKSKPTLIFAHGWKQNEGYKQRDLLSLWESTNSQFHTKGYADDFEFETEYYKTLIGLGYNVAHFYWSQLSDDFVTCDEKIWTSNGTLGMSYVLNDGHGGRIDGDSALNPTKSVAMILGDAIISALGADYQQDLHLVGHSMGGQLVLAAGEYLCLQRDAGLVGEHLVPNIVTLIDPYMTFNVLTKGATVDHLGGKSFDDEEQMPIVSLCADAMETLARHNVAIDSYATVFYRMYEPFMEEEDAAVITERLARYCAWTYLKGLTSKYAMQYGHCMAIDYYFSTLYEATIAKDNYGVEVPSIKASKDYLLSLRGKAFTQSLAEDKAGENPFYMHNSSYTRTDAYYEEVSADYTAYREPAPLTPGGLEIPDEHELNLKLIVPLAVVGGVLVIGCVVAIVLIVLKKKKV